jgi:S1-C subfamily serine protease
MSHRARLITAAGGALVAIAVIGALALVGVFDSGDDTSAQTRIVAVPDAGAAGPVWTTRVYEEAKDAVVFIQAEVGGRQQSPFGPAGQGGTSTGTGFLIDDTGRILTNAHVIENATEVAIRAGESSLVPAKVIGSDPSDDLALIKVAPDALGDPKPLAFTDSDALRVGAPVAALGNPLGLEDTITTGIVSAKQRHITAPDGFTIDNVIQTDAAVNPGNSGGPLVDDQGRVVGINSQIATAPSDTGSAPEGFIGIAFAIPSNTAQKIIPDLEDDGKVVKPYLGVTTVTLTKELAKQLETGVDAGALVVAVADGSPADRAGIRPAPGGGPGGALRPDGDTIVGLGEQDIASTDDLGAAIADHRPGATVELRYVRGGGDERRVDVRLAARPGAG